MEDEEREQTTQKPQDRERAWLKRQRVGNDAEEEWRPPKFHRVAARGCLLRWDNALQSLGLDLARFRLAKLEDRIEPWLWPWLHGCLDRASPNCSGVQCAQRMLDINLFGCWDFNHGSWNAEQQSVKDCGLNSWLLLMLVCLNVMEGPFHSCSRFNESVNRMWQAMREIDPRELPAFMELLPQIAAEAGARLQKPHKHVQQALQEPHISYIDGALEVLAEHVCVVSALPGVDLADPDVALKSWKWLNVYGPLKTRGFKINMNRFFALFPEGQVAIKMFWAKARAIIIG